MAPVDVSQNQHLSTFPDLQLRHVSSIVAPGRPLRNGWPGPVTTKDALTASPEDEEDDLCASALLKKLARKSRDLRRRSSSKAFSFKELELSSMKLDAAHIKISQIDLSFLDESGDLSLPGHTPRVAYNFRIEATTEDDKEQPSDEPSEEIPDSSALWTRMLGSCVNCRDKQIPDFSPAAPLRPTLDLNKPIFLPTSKSLSVSWLLAKNKTVDGKPEGRSDKALALRNPSIDSPTDSESMESEEAKTKHVKALSLVGRITSKWGKMRKRSQSIS